jgi:hypothetical protein
MRRIALLVLFLAAAIVPAALAGSPHFVDNATVVTTEGDTLTVSGKEAGLGNEEQVHIELTATALCVNRGGNNPNATNKTSVTAAGDFPVQNGKAEFTLVAVASFQPDCAPPMTVEFTDIVVTDTTNGITLPLS